MSIINSSFFGLNRSKHLKLFKNTTFEYWKIVESASISTISPKPNNLVKCGIEMLNGTHPNPSLKKGGGLSSRFLSERSPSLFQGGVGVGT